MYLLDINFIDLILKPLKDKYELIYMNPWVGHRPVTVRSNPLGKVLK